MSPQTILLCELSNLKFHPATESEKAHSTYHFDVIEVTENGNHVIKISKEEKVYAEDGVTPLETEITVEQLVEYQKTRVTSEISSVTYKETEPLEDHQPVQPSGETPEVTPETEA